MAIAADPYNTPEKASIFRFKYLQYGFMPIRIIVTNNGDKPISLIDARINFITAAGDKIPAALPEEVERRIGGQLCSEAPRNDDESIGGLKHGGLGAREPC